MAGDAIKSIKPVTDFSIFKEAPELPRRKSVTISGLTTLVNAVKQGGGEITIATKGSADILWPIAANAGNTRKVASIIRLIDDFNASLAALDLPLPARRMAGRQDNSNPFVNIRRLYRQHIRSCPHKSKGRNFIGCSCPIWLSSFTNKKGRLVFEQSLRTKDWEQAEQRRAALDAGESVEGMRRLIRRHFKSCPHRREGVRHIDCDCPIHISAYTTPEGEHVNSRSLNTRNWETGKARLAAIEQGIPVGEVVPKGKLYRLHSPACPHRKEGRRHTKCDCWIYTEHRQDRKLVYRLSLGTNDWEDAEGRQAIFEKTGSNAAVRTLYRVHSAFCPHKPKGRHHQNCDCPIWRDFYKKGKVAHSRSMRTRNWEEAERRLRIEVLDSGDAGPRTAGRPKAKVTIGLYERWAEHGKHWPIEDDEADALAEEFYNAEYRRATWSRRSRTKVHKRIQTSIERSIARSVK